MPMGKMLSLAAQAPALSDTCGVCARARRSKLSYPKPTRLPKQKVVVNNDPSRFSGRSRGEQA